MASATALPAAHATICISNRSVPSVPGAPGIDATEIRAAGVRSVLRKRIDPARLERALQAVLAAPLDQRPGSAETPSSSAGTT